jgi:NAD(P)-dependent dehydrogenase (short-subunit alcohol dehydrogenase family)
MMTLTDGPVALVTGSTSGIGLGVARRLAASGYRVVVHSLSSVDAGRALAAELGNAHYVQADLAIDVDRSRLIDQAVAVWDRLDVLVNNAGISQVIPHRDLAAATPDVWHKLYEVNVIAPFQLITAAEPFLRAAARRSRGAAVVNIGSHAGVRPKGASIPYAVSKAALAHLTKLLAVALAPDIRVNAVAPGLVDTPLTADWADAQTLWRERSPMRRPATPDDIAHTVLSLIESDYITGEVLLVDGGLNLI